MVRTSKQGMGSQIVKHKAVYLMLAPSIILTLVLSIYPIFWVMRYMFYTYDKLHDPVFIGLENFVRIMQDKFFWRTVKNTFIYATGKLIFTIPISFIVAVILNKRFRGSNLFQIIIFMPTIMSAAVMSLVWYLVLNVNSGAVNQVLKYFGLIHKPINWLGHQNAMKTVIMVGIWGAIGNYMTYFMAGLQGVPQEIYESAELEGITSLQKLRYLTIPMIAPAMKTVLLLAITGSFRDIDSIMVLTEGGPAGTTMVMYLYLYQMFFPVNAATSSTSQYGYGAAVAVVCSLIMGVITFLYLRATKKLDELY